ncbi:hypothetical protein PUN28_002963 [Cardiocondyla obscurior]|uniref:Uncharacterized protein n=1 Tax=Cardiocondyla obscurior TaxID=286306 RepID=A0AAW2GWY4_9HYME
MLASPNGTQTLRRGNFVIAKCVKRSRKPSKVGRIVHRPTRPGSLPWVERKPWETISISLMNLEIRLPVVGTDDPRVIPAHRACLARCIRPSKLILHARSRDPTSLPYSREKVTMQDCVTGDIRRGNRYYEPSLPPVTFSNFCLLPLVTSIFGTTSVQGESIDKLDNRREIRHVKTNQGRT